MPKVTRIRSYWRAFAVAAACTGGWVTTQAVAQAGSEQQLASGPMFLMARPKKAGPGASAWRDASDLPVLKRRISLMLRDVPLSAALDTLGRRAGLKVSFSSGVIRAHVPVNLNAPDITVGAAFSALLYDADADVLLTPSGQVAILKRGTARMPAGTIVGRVTDAKSGLGVSGVDVLLQGARWATTTDTIGVYQLTDVEIGTYTLVTRRLGYAKQSRRVTVREGQTDTVSLALDAVAVPLNELVTTATGPQRRRDLGNAITTINADSVLRTAPIRSLTDLLENRVPGLTVQHTSGAPGDPSKLRLRGLTSVYRSNDPVVIVDGVRIYAVQSEERSGNLTNLDPGTEACGGCGNVRVNNTNVPAPSPLDQIDPNIIDKVEVFKGPSAATMYGADAANGVIVITTKRGKAGPTTWQANVTRGRTTTPGEWPTGYYRWGHDMFLGTLRMCTLLSSYCVPDSLVRFQALNEPNLTVLGQGDRTALSLSASGGTQAMQFRVTGSYADEIGLLAMPTFEIERFQALFNRAAPDWMQRPHRYKTWQVSSSITANVSRTMDVTLSTIVGRSEQQRTTLEQQLGSLAGIYVDTVNREYFQPSSAGYAVNMTSNVLADYYTRQTASAFTLTQGLDAQWRPRSWFTSSAHAGLNVIPRNDALLLPAGLVAVNDSGAVVRGSGRSVESSFSLQGTLRKPIGMGFVFLTNLGTNLTTRSTSDQVSSAGGLVPGTTSATGAQRLNVRDSESRNSVFGWYIEPGITGERIAISTGLRLDGGSSYGARITTTSGGLLGGLLGLPKLNGSWVVSEEPWFPFNALFSSLRLRGAYGQSQVQPGPTDRLRIYRGATDQSTSELLLSQLGNTQLRPERATEFEGGFDADLFNSRFSLELTTYRKLQVDALMAVNLPRSVHGGGLQFINIGNIRNTGLELVLGVTPVQSAAMTWRTQLIYSRNVNTLTKLGEGVEANKALGLVKGYPVRSRWARPIIGYSDQNGDQAIETAEVQVGDSLTYVGQLQPAYTSSINTDLQLFDGAVGFSAAFRYEAGGTQINQTARTNWVLAPELTDPSTPLGRQATVVASTRANDPTDYGLMQKVATLRFSTLSVRYRVPLHMARLVGAQRVSVALQGSNLGLHSNYRGMDPNVNAWSPGEQVIDTGQLPQPRTWQVSIDVGF